MEYFATGNWFGASRSRKRSGEYRYQVMFTTWLPMRLTTLVMVLTMTASHAIADEMTLGALVSEGFEVSQMEVLGFGNEELHFVLLLEDGETAYLCKADVGVERDTLTPVLTDSDFSKVLGFVTNGASKWRKCAQVF